MFSNQRKLYRTVETKDFVAGQPISVELPLGYDLDSVIIRLSGTITIGTAPTAYHEFAVPRLVERFDVLSNGKSKYHEVTGLAACLLNYERRLSRSLTDIATGTGAKTVEAFFRLDAINADGVRPKDSNLHTLSPFMSKLQLKIQCNEFADMVKTLGSFAVSSNTLTLEVMVEETQEFVDAAYFEDRLVKVQSLIEETIDATKTNHRVKLATGDLLTRGVKIYFYDENGALTNAVLNSVQLKSGQDVPYYKTAADIRAANVDDYRLPLSQLPDGAYFVDLCPDGNLNKLWDTRGKSELDLIMDVTKPAGGDATAVIHPLQFWVQDNSAIRAQLGG